MADWDTSKHYADPNVLAAKLGVDADNEDMLSALARVTQRFIGEIHRTLHLVEGDEYWASGDGGTIITVPGVPVVGDPVVEIDGVPVSDYRVGRRTGMFQRRAGWPKDLENIHITYSHGHTVIPGDVQDVILETAEAAAYYQAGVKSVSTGDENIQFSDALINGGSTPLWNDVVARYRFDSNGDGE